MPFSKYDGFNSDTLKIMTEAYDAAVARLGINSSDPRTGKIAAHIVSLASAGQRDPKILCDLACAAVK